MSGEVALVWQPYFVLLNLHLKGICGTHSLHVVCVQSLKDIQYEMLCIVYYGMKMNVCMYYFICLGVKNECLYVIRNMLWCAK